MSNPKEPFNTPLETGLRSLAVLEASYPDAYDLHRLVQFDYLVVHSADIGGPSSLHTALPLRAGELLVRHQLVEKGLLLMISKGLLLRHVSPNGIEYSASETSSSFLSSLTSAYTLNLRYRAKWLVSSLYSLPTDEIRLMITHHFEHWASDFEVIKPVVF